MKNKIISNKNLNCFGFTLIELLATIVIIGITITIIAVKIEGNIKKAGDLDYENQLALINDAAIIYANEYENELTDFSTLKINYILISTLITKGLIDEKNLTEINIDDYVAITEYEGNINAKYTSEVKNIIFLKGNSKVSIYLGKTYTDLGAYVAIPNTGLIDLTNSNVNSTVNTQVLGNYIVTYSYGNAESVIRNVSVIN